MLSAGGICFVFFAKLNEKLKTVGLFIKALIGSAFITTVEFIFGILFNVVLKKNVWDYSAMPFNIGGQICAMYSFYWLVLSFLFMPLADKIRSKTR